jgi:hypothetical protein
MKIIYTCLSLICTLSAFSQKDSTLDILHSKDGYIVYERVITVDSTSKEDLYKRAKIWSLTAFKSQKAALQSDDKELGLLSFKSTVQAPYTAATPAGKETVNWLFWNLLTIYLKDSKVKLVMNQFSTDGGLYGTQNLESYAGYLTSTVKNKKVRDNSLQSVYRTYHYLNAEVTSMLNGLETALRSKTESDF